LGIALFALAIALCIGEQIGRGRDDANQYKRGDPRQAI
jgi:hypothetical protein